MRVPFRHCRPETGREDTPEQEMVLGASSADRVALLYQLIRASRGVLLHLATDKFNINIQFPIAINASISRKLAGPGVKKV